MGRGWSNRSFSLGRPCIRKQQVNHHGDQRQWCWLRAEARAEGSNLPWGRQAGSTEGQGAITWLSTGRGQVLSSQPGASAGVKV